MSCTMDPAQLSAYLDNELSGDERARVEAHLAECAACRSELDSLRAVAKAVRALPPVAPPPEFADALRQGLLARTALAHGAPAPGAPVDVSDPGGAHAQAVRVLPAAAPQRGHRRPWSSVAVAAAAALLVGWGSASVLYGHGLPGLPGAGHDLAFLGGSSSGAAGQGTAAGSPSAAGAMEAKGATPPSDSSQTASGASAAGAASANTDFGTNKTVYPSIVSSEALPGSSAFASSGVTAARAPVPQAPRSIRTASLSLTVPDVEAGYALALQRVVAFHGQVFSASYPSEGDGMASLQISVPADQMDGLMASLAPLGDLEESSVTGDEVEDRFTQLDQQLAALKEDEKEVDQSPAVMSSMAVAGSADSERAPAGSEAGTAPETIEDVHEQEAEVQAQRQALELKVEWASLRLTLHPAN